MAIDVHGVCEIYTYMYIYNSDDVTQYIQKDQNIGRNFSSEIGMEWRKFMDISLRVCNVIDSDITLG